MGEKNNSIFLKQDIKLPSNTVGAIAHLFLTEAILIKYTVSVVHGKATKKSNVKRVLRCREGNSALTLACNVTFPCKYERITEENVFRPVQRCFCWDENFWIAISVQSPEYTLSSTGKVFFFPHHVPFKHLQRKGLCRAHCFLPGSL